MLKVFHRRSLLFILSWEQNAPSQKHHVECNETCDHCRLYSKLEEAMIRIKALEKLLSRGLAFVDRVSAKNTLCVLLGGQLSAKVSYLARPIVGSGVTTRRSNTRHARIARRGYQVHAAPRPSVTGRLVPHTRLDPHSRVLRVKWSNGEQRLYPYAWLRDCCRCSACFHEGTRSRMVQFHDINLNDMPTDVEVFSLFQSFTCFKIQFC